jgi:6-phosphogluconate dehydrogenase
MTEPTADIAVIGLAVMGRNLALNMADHGFQVAVYNRTTARKDEFMAEEGSAAGIIAADTLEELVPMLKTPRRALIMVQAGPPTDAVINQLSGLLDPGDIILDGGNAHYDDTARRTSQLEAEGFLFIGTGVSGGEEGARYGPSIMPGGSPAAWPEVKEILQSIAAKVADGTPCCDWVGPGGAGHYVKMVHNGIEYGDMQVLAEAYALLHRGLRIPHDEMAAVFTSWKDGPLNSYLTDITADIMAFREQDGSPLLDKILDAAGQKGTGKWTGISSLQLGVPVTLVSEAVYARVVSALKDQRVAASEILSGPPPVIEGDRKSMIEDIHDALYASKIVSYAQGFMLLKAAAKEYEWELNFGGIAYLWREGCIIRSALLEHIKQAFALDPALESLMIDPYFQGELEKSQPGWRRTVGRAVEAGIPVPAYSTALAFYDGYRTVRLPANLIQAQRDYFGAHTYERVDRPRGEFFHTEWAGEN